MEVRDLNQSSCLNNERRILEDRRQYITEKYMTAGWGNDERERGVEKEREREEGKLENANSVHSEREIFGTDETCS